MKEQQKQHLIDMITQDEELGLYGESKQENCCTPEGQIKRYKDCKGCDKKPKQETLEEAAERLYPISSIPRKLFIRGAKWQQERSYSEEDMREAFEWGVAHITFEEWIRRFKKK
jgi:hypothetical protein